MGTLIREFAVLVVTLALTILVVGALGRGEMIVAPPDSTWQAWTVGATAAVLVGLGMVLSGGVRGPSVVSRFLGAWAVTAAVMALAAGGGWIWVNLPDERLQVLMALFGVTGLGLVVMHYGSLIGGLPRVLRLHLALLLLVFIVIGTPVDIIMTWRVIDYPSNIYLQNAWAFGAAVLPFMLLDMLWIRFVMEKLYLNAMGKAVLLGVDELPNGRKVKLAPRLGWGFIAWLTIVGGLATLIIVPHMSDEWWQIGLWAAGFGFVTSAFYAGTNLTGLRNYTFKLGVYDTIWGMLLCTGITLYVRAAAQTSPIDFMM